MNSLRCAIAVCQKHLMSSSLIHDRIKKMLPFSAISRLALIANRKVYRWAFLYESRLQECWLHCYRSVGGIAFAGPPVSRLHFTFYSPNGVTLPATLLSLCTINIIRFFSLCKRESYSLRRMSRGGAPPNLENIVCIRTWIWGVLVAWVTRLRSFRRGPCSTPGQAMLCTACYPLSCLVFYVSL